MNPIILHEWEKPERQVQFLGYSRDFNAAFITDVDGIRRVLRFRLPEGFGLQFARHPIQEADSPPVTIRRTAIHIPACFPSMTELELEYSAGQVQLAKAGLRDKWLHVTRHRCCLDAEDESELERLRSIRDKELRAEFVSTKRAIPSLPQSERREALKVLQQSFPRRMTTGERGKKFEAFQITNEMIRDLWQPVLLKRWAAKNGLLLADIGRDSAAFRKWIDPPVGMRQARALNCSVRNVSSGVSEPGFSLNPRDWETLEATINYEIRFAAGAAVSRVWLHDIQLSDSLSTEEIGEFDRLQSRSSLIQAPAVASQGPSCRWHSNEFREIHRLGKDGRVVSTVRPHSELRALCLILAKHVGCMRPYSEVEPKIGDLASELDRSAGTVKPANRGSRRIRQLLQTTEGRKLVKWSVIRTVPAGREKQIGLFPIELP